MHHRLGLIYLDTEIMNKDIYLYNGIEMYVEPLDGPDPKKCRTQRVVYIRRWHPSSYTVEPTQGIVLSNTTPAELKLEVSYAMHVNIIPIILTDITAEWNSL